jgi:flagellar assembly protein FliH
MKRIITADEAMACGDGLRLLDLPDVAGEARRLLAQAAIQARELVESARREADSLRREAMRKGHAEGFARGRQEGAGEARRAVRQEALHEFSAELAEVTALARKMVEGLQAARADVLRQGQAQMLDFAIELARKIVGRAAETDSRAAIDNLHKALELAGRVGCVTVLANPSQARMLQEKAGELLEAVRLGGEVTVRADERVDRGGVRVLCRRGEIDATIRSQLDNVVESLLGTACEGASRV